LAFQPKVNPRERDFVPQIVQSRLQGIDVRLDSRQLPLHRQNVRHGLCAAEMLPQAVAQGDPGLESRIEIYQLGADILQLDACILHLAEAAEVPDRLLHARSGYAQLELDAPLARNAAVHPAAQARDDSI